MFGTHLADERRVDRLARVLVDADQLHEHVREEKQRQHNEERTAPAPALPDDDGTSSVEDDGLAADDDEGDGSVGSDEDGYPASMLADEEEATAGQVEDDAAAADAA